jgi:hypothetical protein
MRNFLFLAVVLLMTTWASASNAELRVIGKGDALRFDTAQFPPNMKNAYDIMVARCTKCHSQHRIVMAYITGFAPVSKKPFDNDVMKITAFKMLRKAGLTLPDGLTKEQRRAIVEERRAIASLLNYLMDESTR